MARRIWVVAGTASVLLLAGVFAAFASSSAAGTKIHVIEHATTDTVIDTGGAGDTSGDLLTFHNLIYNRADTTRVGSDQGECIRISPQQGTWECTFTTFLSKGHISVEGPFSDNHSTRFSVTGGTGAYSHASGTMLLRSRAGGAKYDFLFRVRS